MNKTYQIFEVDTCEVEILHDKMDAFIASQLSFSGKIEENINYVFKDTSSNIIAGIKACLYLKQYLFISLIFVDERYRKQGLGSLLLNHLEEKAKILNVRLIHLDTFDFQEKDFYLKRGYEIFGVLDDCPLGHKRYYMKKTLN